MIVKPNYECCDKGPPPSSTDARMCRFECAP
ncbi:DUF1272 domain-containing protein [Pelagibius sp. Alg239-R121]